MGFIAPAKLNLFLNVADRRADGFYNLESLVVFCAHGDELMLTPAPALELAWQGPFAHQRPQHDLLLETATQFGRATGQTPKFRITLTKNLPSGAGLGGASSDAATLLLALNEIWELHWPLEKLADWAIRLGSDVPVCLYRQPMRVEGRGERLTPLPPLPTLPLVLLNCGMPVPTADVFAAYRQPPAPLPQLSWPDFKNLTQGGLIKMLKTQRNDLTAAAQAQCPDIGDALTTLAAQPGCLLSRMSGSGATCFGIFKTAEEAQQATTEIAAWQPGWWLCLTQTEDFRQP